MQRFHFDATDSTNTQARALSAAHPGEVLLVTAAEQTAGRGRLGRAWHSPRGGAWMSLVWPLSDRAKDDAAVSVAAAEAVHAALKSMAPNHADRFVIKWSNDILIYDYKVAGILCEQCPVRDEPAKAVIIIGVGVNVDFDSVQLGADLRRPATTLSAALGRPIAVDDVIGAVSNALVATMTQFSK